MRDLTKIFHQQAMESTMAASAMLLRIDSNVPARQGVMLAGGWVRDTYFGVKPKDMDFAFWGMSESDMRQVLHMFVMRSPYDVTVAEFEQYEGGDARLALVIKVTEMQPDGPVDMDWILYRATNPQDVLEAFDHSLNAFYMRYDPDFRLMVGHHGEWGVCTRNHSVDCSEERADRMREMARIVDWEYV